MLWQRWGKGLAFRCDARDVTIRRRALTRPDRNEKPANSGGFVRAAVTARRNVPAGRCCAPVVTAAQQCRFGCRPVSVRGGKPPGVNTLAQSMSEKQLMQTIVDAAADTGLWLVYHTHF